jgi:hypothetical protein
MKGNIISEERICPKKRCHKFKHRRSQAGPALQMVVANVYWAHSM